MKSWQLQEAKARLGEVVEASQTAGPQEITVHGRPVALVLSKGDYDRLRGGVSSLVDFLQRSPLVGVELSIERDKSPTRGPRM